MSTALHLKTLDSLENKLKKTGHEAQFREAVKGVKTGNLRPLQDLVIQLELQLQKLDFGGSSSSGTSSEFDEIVSDVGALSSAGRNLDPLVGDITQLALRAFESQRDFLNVAKDHSKPDQAETMKLLEPTAALISEIQALRERNRSSAWFNHLSAISEAIPALGWVNVSPAPAPFVKEMRDASQFFTNRILRDRKQDKQWIDLWLASLTKLQEFVKRNHTTGLQWNASGKKASASLVKSTVSAPTASPKTAVSPPSPSKPAAPKILPKFGNPAAGKAGSPCRLELEGKKWIVENFDGNRSIQLDDIKPNQSISVYNCKNSVLKVNGKCNNLVINSCRKMAVVFDSLISSCEVINSQGTEIQILGSAPLVSLDKCDGAQIYLSKESMQTEVITAKSSGMNILVPGKDGDFKELPIPDQFKSILRGKTWETVPTEAV